MPLYEYYCSDCRTKFEALRSMSQADEPIQCEKCEGWHTARAISLFAAFSDGASLMSNDTGCAACGSHACATCGSH